MRQEKKIDAKKIVFSKSFENDYYINSLANFIENNGDNLVCDIKEFINTLSISQDNDKKNNQFYDYMNSLKKSKDFKRIQEIMKLIGEIGLKYPELTGEIVDKLVSFLESDESVEISRSVIHELGHIGHVKEKTCSKIIAFIDKVTHKTTNHDVTIEAIHALYEIGLAWKKKKQIFFPLIDILKRGDKEEKIEAIRALRTQIEGYYERPVEELKLIVLNDEDVDVRRAAAVTLGEIGAYTSFSVREAVFELIDNIGRKIRYLKIMLESNQVDNFYIKCSLYDTKSILKVLYHYVRIYKYGNI